MGPPGRPLPPGLAALRRDIATAEHPVTAMRWLTKPSIAPVLSGLAAGRIPLTHQALDELGASQPLAHLRQALVAVGALPARDEEMVRLEAFLGGLLASQHDTERRQLCTATSSGTWSGGCAAATTAGRHPAAVPHDPPARPRRRRVPGLA